MSMFSVVEGGATVDKPTFEKRVAKLRVALLGAQYEVLEQKKFPVVVLINGVEGAGKGETVNLLQEWMDPRHVQVHAVGAPTDEEAERPPMYRFWRRLPPKGKLGVFFGNWYTMPILDRVLADLSKEDFDDALAEIQRFETMLVREGALVLKFWFHLSKKAQKHRLQELESDKKTAWRVTKDDWKRFEKYDDFVAASQHALKKTDSADAPWILVDGTDHHHRALFVGDHLLASMRTRLDEKPNGAKKSNGAAKATKVPRRRLTTPTVVGGLDLTQKLEKDDYEKELDKWTRRLALLTRHKKFHALSPVIVFEGADAAGKGGAIRRVTRALDARIYDIVPVAAPSDEERAQPYLWRFWRHAPRDGKFVVFDRSWYGRVLVERVEGFAEEKDWRRAYDEINDFELQLERAGCPIAKFWLQISQAEQLRRFKEREATKWKNFKITAEDWRNRDKWDQYDLAAAEMIAKTSPKNAPWTVVEAEDKYFARVKVLKTIVETIERAL